MRLDFWNKRDCECQCAPPAPELSKEAEGVCRMSPARLLANSLTDPETRGEWKRETGRNMAWAGPGQSTIYRNEKRDLTITRWWVSSLYSFSAGVSTPFTLSKAEEEIVKAALDAYNRHQTDLAEAAALSRLTASGTPPRENAKRSRAKPSGPAPRKRGDAQ